VIHEDYVRVEIFIAVKIHGLLGCDTMLWRPQLQAWRLCPSTSLFYCFSMVCFITNLPFIAFYLMSSEILLSETFLSCVVITFFSHSVMRSFITCMLHQ